MNNDTNLGASFVYDSPEEKEIENQRLKINKLYAETDAQKKLIGELIERLESIVAKISPIEVYRCEKLSLYDIEEAKELLTKAKSKL